MCHLNYRPLDPAVLCPVKMLNVLFPRTRYLRQEVPCAIGKHQSFTFKYKMKLLKPNLISSLMGFEFRVSNIQLRFGIRMPRTVCLCLR